MPANLSPEYKAAAAAFSRARDPRERLEWLREMLRAIPKHKGTEHLQADIKGRIKDLSGEVEGGRKAAGHGGPPLVIRPEGAAQVALVGPPNAGKSALHASLTGSAAHVAPYPFTTQYPEPGMMPHEDIHFQLIDLPAISPAHPVPWLAGALQTSDAALIVLDLGDPSCVEQAQAVLSVLESRGVTLSARWPASNAGIEPPGDDDDPFARRLPALILANKADECADAAVELEAFRELSALPFEILSVSAATGTGLDELGPWLFGRLGIARIYTKAPGHPPDRGKPFTLRPGGTVGTLARQIHNDLAHTLRYARVWGHSGFDGQHVGTEHVLSDGDVVELHT